MGTILEAVGSWLDTNHYADLATDLFLSRMPDSPDACVAVYEDSGPQPTFTMGQMISRPLVRVLVRGAPDDYPGARDKAESIRVGLAGMATQTIDGVYVIRISPSGSVTPLGSDGSARPLLQVLAEAVVG